MIAWLSDLIFFHMPKQVVWCVAAVVLCYGSVFIYLIVVYIN